MVATAFKELKLATLLHIVVSKRMDASERVLFFCVCCDAAVLRIPNMDQKRLSPKWTVARAEVVRLIFAGYAGNNRNRMGEASDLSSGLLRLIQYNTPSCSIQQWWVVVFVDFSCYVTSNVFRANGEIKADGKSSILEDNGYIRGGDGWGGECTD